MTTHETVSSVTEQPISPEQLSTTESTESVTEQSISPEQPVTDGEGTTHRAPNQPSAPESVVPVETSDSKSTNPTETSEVASTTEPSDEAVITTESSDSMTLESAEPPDISTATPEIIPSNEELTRQLAEATQTAENHWDSLLRKQAEYENLQKRMSRDVENARKYALEKFATELLAVKDSMELGIEAATKPETPLEAVREGITLTAKMLTDTLNKFGIVEINPQDEKFNPQWHEAMAIQPVPNVEEGTVLHVHQKGYQLNDRLLRPARVIVAKAIDAEKPLENQG